MDRGKYARSSISTEQIKHGVIRRLQCSKKVCPKGPFSGYIFPRQENILHSRILYNVGLSPCFRLRLFDKKASLSDVKSEIS